MPRFTTKKTPSGTFEIFDNGRRVSTGTKEVADSFLSRNNVAVEDPDTARERVSRQGKEGFDVFGNPVEGGATPATSGVRRYTSVGNPFSGTDRDFTTDDAERIREETAQQMQAQIDAIETTYAGLISDEEQRGEQRAGRTRAISARGGLGGSPRGAAQAEKTSKFNAQLVGQLQAQKAAEINAVYTKIDDRSDERIAAERERTEGNLENYLNFLEKYREDARLDAALLGSAGFSLDDLDPADVDDLLTDTGFQSKVLLEAYINANRPEETQIKYNYEYDETTGEVLAYGVDPSTGKLTTQRSPLGTPKPSENSKLEEFPDGRLAWVDEENKSIEFLDGVNVAKPKDQKGGTSDTEIADLDREDENFFLDVIRSSKGGKAPTQTERQSLSKAFTVIDQVDLLQSNIGDEQTGPILGTIRKNNPYDEKAQTIKAQLTAIIPNLARGVFGEVGVLTDNDVKLYAQTLPNLTSTEDIRKAVLGLTLRTVLKAIENQLETGAASGLDVSGFESKYKSIRDTVTTIESELGVGSTAEEEVDPADVAIGEEFDYQGTRYIKKGDDEFEEI